MTTAALILGTGATASSDLIDPMLEVGAATIVQRLARTFQEGGVSLLVLVAKPPLEPLQKHVARLGVVCLESEGQQMLDGAKVGLAYLKGRCDQILITPVDIPLFTADTVRKLIDSGALVASPVCENRTGHPLMISAEIAQVIIGYKGENGIRGALRAAGCKRELIPVNDAGVLLDVDSDHEYQSLLEQRDRRMTPEFRLRLVKGRPCLGQGTAWLLSLIDTTGSVRLACRQMGMSYSKAWKLLGSLEDAMGCPIVHRQQGGKNGGAANLTPRGRDLLDRYTAFNKDCQVAVQGLFEKYFGDF